AILQHLENHAVAPDPLLSEEHGAGAVPADSPRDPPMEEEHPNDETEERTGHIENSLHHRLRERQMSVAEGDNRKRRDFINLRRFGDDAEDVGDNVDDDAATFGLIH